MYSTEFDDSTRTMKIYDKYTMYVDTFDATDCQIYESIKSTITNISKMFGCKTYYKINIVNNIRKYAYLRVTSHEVYNILIGRNKDGSKRVYEIEDPDFVKPEEEYNKCLDRCTHGVTEWWLLDEIERDLKSKYSPQIITKQLGPMIELDDYQPGKKLKIGRAYINNLKDEYKPNVIFSNVPGWLNDKILRPYLSSYVSEEFKVCKNGKPFPLISFKNNKYGNSVYVSFDKKSYDTQFFLLMNKLLKVKNPKNGTIETLNFSYLKK